MAWNFKTDLAAPEGINCGEDITEAVVTSRLEDMYVYFPPYRKSWGAGREDVEHAPTRERVVVLGGIPSGKKPFSVMECLRPGPLTQLNHFMVIGCLRGASQWEHSH